MTRVEDDGRCIHLMSFLDPIIMHDCVTSNACDWIGYLFPIAIILSCCPTVVLEFPELFVCISFIYISIFTVYYFCKSAK